MSPSRPVAGPRRMIGRQLTRASALCQRLKLPAVAEVGFRAALRLTPEPALAFRLGRLQEARRHWAAADATYLRCLQLVDHSPPDEHRRAVLHYRQARVRVQRRDWEGAETAFVAALQLRPELAVWHAHRAEARIGGRDWEAAAASYQQALARDLDRPAWRAALVRSLTSAGHPDQAVRAGTGEHLVASDYPPLARELAGAYEAVGDWPAAAALLRGLVADRPGDRALRSRLAGCLDYLHRVPSTLLGGAGSRPAAVGAREHHPDQVSAELADQLGQLAADPPQRPNDLFRLGLHYERDDRLVEAAETYQQAMSRLSAVDSWWCHKAAYDWEFRLAYVRNRLGPLQPPLPRLPQLRRSVAPAPGPAGASPAGYFDALIAREGLQLTGYLLPGTAGPEPVIAVYVDGQPLKRVRANAASWRPTFRYDLSAGLLADFPERSRIAVRAGDRPLVTTGGGDRLEVHVPGGRNKLSNRLAGGLAPTKKGAWPFTGRRLHERHERYLEVYQRARELLAAHGRQLFLSYGTLLGCQRDGGFIPGDDDFDASYVSYAADPVSFRRECQQVGLYLIRHGLDVGFAINGRMLKLGLAGVWIDVTPTWFFRDRAWSFRAHDLVPDAIEPVRAGRLVGQPVLVPQAPETFLADAYGPEWRTPQPDFRHYRSKADNQVLSLMWARPSEAREFARLAGALRPRTGSVGRFAGVGVPAYPGFNWLIPAPEPPTSQPVQPPTGLGDPAASVR